MRLDKYLSQKYSNVSRSEIKKMIVSANVLVNGELKKPSYIVVDTDKVTVSLPKVKSLEVKSEIIDLPIIHEEKDYIVIDKPAGMVVHPSPSGHLSGTVVNALFSKIGRGVGDELRPGIVHRLDKDTSGLMIVAKTGVAYKYFVDLFKSHKLSKGYLALVKGLLEHKEGIIDSPIARDVTSRKKMAISSSSAGKEAKTSYKVIEEFEYKEGAILSLLDVKLHSGRTHQIRVHMSAINHPIVGDTSYGTVGLNRKFADEFQLRRQFLHAGFLEFVDLNGEKRTFKSPLPKELESVLKLLRG